MPQCACDGGSVLSISSLFRGVDHIRQNGSINDGDVDGWDVGCCFSLSSPSASY